jgi:hypothetical protein
MRARTHWILAPKAGINEHTATIRASSANGDKWISTDSKTSMLMLFCTI